MAQRSESPNINPPRQRYVSLVDAKPNEEHYMLEKIMAACSVAIVLIGLSLYSLGGHAQSEQMARHEPHMSAAYGHLQQARAELDKASPNKGGHREKAIQLVDQAMQEVQAGEAYDQERPK